jgi:hypothetical protein
LRRARFPITTFIFAAFHLSGRLAPPYSAGLEYTGTVEISVLSAFRTAMRLVGSTAGLSSETPMARTFAFSIAAVSFLQSDPDASTSLWPSLCRKNNVAFATCDRANARPAGLFRFFHAGKAARPQEISTCHSGFRREDDTGEPESTSKPEI